MRFESYFEEKVGYPIWYQIGYQIYGLVKTAIVLFPAAEFQRVWQQLGGAGWPWFQSFVTDVSLSGGRLQELFIRTDAARLPPAPAAPGGGPPCCRPLLQRLAAAFGSGDYQVSGRTRWRLAVLH